MFLLALAVAPAIAIIFYIIGKDKYNKEPFKNLFISFLLGVVSTIPAIIIQFFLRGIIEMYKTDNPLLYYAILAFCIIGFSEEGSKYLMLRMYAFNRKAFDEPLDGIIYGVMVSMGFATLENIIYIFEGGYGTAIVRMFLSVPAHACFGVIMGYYVGMAKFNKANSRFLKRIGLLYAILFHGAFDFFLLLQQSELILQYLSTGLLAVGALGSFYFAIRLSRRSIRLHQELSRIDFERINRFL
jgi:RsiW-degrading membrane proteinase PrsW (M82 family)